MAINLSDLPPKYQAQAMEKYMKQQARRRRMPSAAAVQDPRKENKYHNTPTTRVAPSGVVLHFDSQKEARRYDFLIERVRRGEIGDLRLQVDFTLQEAYTDAEGRRVRAIRYKADFTYRERDRGLVVEDVKSRPTRTKEYSMKKKMLKDRFGIDITEV